jgi:hypothetical protein
VQLIDEAETLNDGYFYALTWAQPEGRFVDCPSIMHNNGAVFLFFRRAQQMGSGAPPSRGGTDWSMHRHRAQALLLSLKSRFPESTEYQLACQREY